MEEKELTGVELSDDDMDQVLGGVDQSMIFKGEVPNVKGRKDIVKLMMSRMASRNEWEE